MPVSVGRSLAIIFTVAGTIFFTRLIPFLFFPKGKEIPPIIRYLGRVLPPAVIGMLVIYCLKNVSVLAAPFGLPEFIAVAAVIVGSVWSLLRDSLRLSLDGVPEGIRLEEVERTIASVEGVRGVHHIHIWAISTTENALTAHVVLEPEAEARMEQVKHQVKERLHEAGIGHATLEFETAGEHCCEPHDL